jgi:anti-sigma factor RsiW
VIPCDPEKVTGHVDGALDPATAAAVEVHLAECASCRAQAAEERELRAALKLIPPVELPPGLPFAVRSRLRRRPGRFLRVALPVAAALAVVALWGRNAAPFVAWELARDHAHCFGKDRLPAQVWASDAATLTAWFAEKGTRLPYLPDQAGGAAILGARFCPLADRRVAHVYYGGGRERTLSFYVVPGHVRFDGARRTRVAGRTVHLTRLEGRVVALVSEDADNVDALERALTTTVARLEPLLAAD